MITLALLNQMAKEGVADLSKDEDFFWEELPLQRAGKPAEGVWLVTRQGDISQVRKGQNLRSTVDFYVGFNNKVKTEVIHQAILEWLFANRSICELSGSVEGTNYDYAFSNIRIQPTTTPENYGATENGTIVKVASALLIYDLSTNKKGKNYGN